MSGTWRVPGAVRRRGGHGFMLPAVLTAAMLGMPAAWAADPGGVVPGQASGASPSPGAADKGFSYFLGVARQDVRYVETSALLPVRSEAKTSSALLMTGALYAFSDDVLFSLDSESTFYPVRTTETWTSPAAVFNGVTLSTPVLQTNGFSLSQTQLQLLGHYRVRGPWFGSAGVVFRSQSFKRFAFVGGPDAAVTIPVGATVEESTGEVLLQLGLALESEHVRRAARHYGVRATVGVPVWRRVENTSQPALQFDGRQGVDLALEGRYSLAVHSSVHVGLWGKWALAMRARQAVDTRAELPESRQHTLSYGLEMLWKL